ncbi:ABC transporter permease [Alkalihalobacterium sp. APHAB7]|uniref:ABC transporter permease n=1 Tax=Alkalihalobacterium sp. APHAB7 TaxID=3402081 RepID=UPI003AABEA6E
MRNEIKGTGILTFLAFKRDRLRLFAWLAVIMTLVTSVGIAMNDLMPTQEEVMKQVVARAESPAIRLFDIPAAGISVESAMLMRSSILIGIIIVLVSMQTVIRHTRQNEETGRTEMISSTAVGKYASLASGLIVTVIFNILVGITIASAMLFNNFDMEGSLLIGFVFAGIGIAFAGITSIAVQLSQTSSGATGMVTITFGLVFLISSIGDVLGEFNRNTFAVESHWLVWLSPWGWLGQVYAFHENNWWILWLFYLLFIATVFIAIYLVTKRDVGMGLFPAKKGPAFASRMLLSPIGLMWRLQRRVILSWVVAMFIFGMVIGGIGNEIRDMVSGLNNDQLLEMFGGNPDLVSSIMASFVGFLATFVAVYFVLGLLRLRHDEVDGFMEGVLATGVSRVHLLMSQFICVGLGLWGILIFLALGAGTTAKVSTGDAMFLTMLEVTFYQAPAILTIGAFTILLIGILPKGAIAVSLAAVLFSIISGPMFGTMLGLPEIVQSISPFSYTTVGEAGNIDWINALGLTVIAMIFITVGILSYSRRNLTF